MKWRGVPGWEDRYEISEYGHVRSKNMLVGAKAGKTALRKGRQLKWVVKYNGYHCVTLAKGKTRTQILVHRLVAAAFLRPVKNKPNVLHTDGNKINNHYTNLRYGTQADNNADTRRHGRVRVGAAHPLARLSEADIKDIRSSHWSLQGLAKRYRVSINHIYAIKRRRVWRHVP